MDPLVFLTTILGFLLFLATFNLLRFRRKCDQLLRHQILLDRRIHELAERNQKLKNASDINASFSQNLEDIDPAARKIKLSQSRYQSTINRSSAPERYRYMRSLAHQGKNHAELATLFSVSSDEARQLSTLSRLNQSLPADNARAL